MPISHRPSWAPVRRAHRTDYPDLSRVIRNTEPLPDTSAPELLLNAERRAKLAEAQLAGRARVIQVQAYGVTYTLGTVHHCRSVELHGNDDTIVRCWHDAPPEWTSFGVGPCHQVDDISVNLCSCEHYTDAAHCEHVAALEVAGLLPITHVWSLTLESIDADDDEQGDLADA
jgi:hypothetical protein